MTTAERRLSALEANLSPTDRVKGWLAEAHQHVTFDAYFESILAAGIEGSLSTGSPARRRRPPSRRPADCPETSGTGRSVRRSLRRSSGSSSSSGRSFSPRRRSNARRSPKASSARTSLCSSWKKASRAAHPFLRTPRASARSGTSPSPTWPTCTPSPARAPASRRAISTEPRSLFPQMGRDWAAQVERSERVAVLAVRQAELDGIAPPPEDDPDVVEARVARRVADHVDPALLKAYDGMGDSRRAASIALRWLTPRAAPET